MGGRAAKAERQRADVALHHMKPLMVNEIGRAGIHRTGIIESYHVRSCDQRHLREAPRSAAHI
jgi:hypothetical protein